MYFLCITDKRSIIIIIIIIIMVIIIMMAKLIRIKTTCSKSYFIE